jgi:hypothetical protein
MGMWEDLLTQDPISTFDKRVGRPIQDAAESGIDKAKTGLSKLLSDPGLYSSDKADKVIKEQSTFLGRKVLPAESFAMTENLRKGDPTNPDLALANRYYEGAAMARKGIGNSNILKTTDKSPELLRVLKAMPTAGLATAWELSKLPGLSNVRNAVVNNAPENWGWKSYSSSPTETSPASLKNILYAIYGATHQ